MEVEIKTKYGIRKIQIEKVKYTEGKGNDCAYCSYKEICDKLTSIDRLHIPVNKRYKEDYGSEYRDFDLFCTYEIPLGFIPTPGTLEKNLLEIFPDAPINDIINYCKNYCILIGSCETCVLKKWIDEKEKEEIQIQFTEVK